MKTTYTLLMIFRADDGTGDWPFWQEIEASSRASARRLAKKVIELKRAKSRMQLVKAHLCPQTENLLEPIVPHCLDSNFWQNSPGERG